MPTNEDIQKTLNDFMNGFKPLRRSNPKTGQSEWYYMVPKNPSDEFTEYDYIDVPSPNTPNPLKPKQDLLNKAIIIAQKARGKNFIPTLGEVVGNLHAAKKEMDTVRKKGYDNYAHRLGMCLNSQNGFEQSVYSFGAGVFKELKDIVAKIPQKGVEEAWNDSVKDMKNNIEGIKYGFSNPQSSCRKWLNNLDYENNKWRK